MKRHIIHQHTLQPIDKRIKHLQPHTPITIHYLCNPTAKANWMKTTITNKKVTCKNCKKIKRHTK